MSNIQYTASMRNKAFNSKAFPKEAFYLFDELDFILNKKNHGVLIGKNYHETIAKIILEFYKMEYLNYAKKEAQKDMIIYSAVFGGNENNPSIEQIRKFMPNLKYNHPPLIKIALNVISKSQELEELKNLLGYEIMGLIAYFFLGSAAKITNFDYIRASFKKMVPYKKINNKQTANEKFPVKFCFKASEALFIAKNLYFENKQKNLIETAKYLIEKIRKETIQEVTETVTQEATKIALKNNSKKALEARHKINHQTKEQFLNAYDRYVKESLEKGEIPSKNQFSKDFAPKYGISESTARNNWLKGYTPKNLT